MSRRWCGTALAVVLLGLAASWTQLIAEDDKEPSIKAIMTKAHKGGNSLIKTLEKDLKSAEPDWKDDEKKAKELVKLGTALGKNMPPKGSKESWEKLTKSYVDTAKDLEAAVTAKEKKKAVTAHTKLTKMCAACHKAHKGK
ncbi:MAG TPA: hypothetical protein VMG10_34670 [Gemmataceae bacterium]|nr:hypothetical protein [Gemmataceae bacterium]